MEYIALLKILSEFGNSLYKVLCPFSDFIKPYKPKTDHCQTYPYWHERTLQVPTMPIKPWVIRESKTGADIDVLGILSQKLGFRSNPIFKIDYRLLSDVRIYCKIIFLAILCTCLQKLQCFK